MTELHTTDPIVIFQEWLDQAIQSEINDPNAMTIATVGSDGIPSARMVLLKAVEEGCFIFNTNKNSRKAQEIQSNPVVSLLFHWKSLRRQVRIVGKAVAIEQSENQKYFNTRATISQQGAWASKQSQPLDSRDTLLKRIAEIEEKYKGTDIPCPDFWGGYKIIPHTIELWMEGEFRLHDRFIFEKDAAGNWQQQRLYP